MDNTPETAFGGLSSFRPGLHRPPLSTLLSALLLSLIEQSMKLSALMAFLVPNTSIIFPNATTCCSNGTSSIAFAVCCCDKHYNQKELGEERLACCDCLQSIMEGRPDRNSDRNLQAGTDAEP